MSATEPVKIQLGARRERIALLLGALLIVVTAVPLYWLSRPIVAHGRVQILAHRGASAYAPENTLSAFRVAIDQRADWLELDVQQSKDGQLVVFHDLRMERTTNGHGNLRDLTLEQIQALDAGSWFDAKFAGEKVPTFEEVVALARERGIKIFPEIKDPRFSPGIEERMAAVISANDYEDNTIVQSFDMDSLERLRQANPRLKMAALYSATAPLRGDPPPGVSVVGPAWELVSLDPSIVRDAHANGREVVVWSVDSGTPLRSLLDAQVDGIITDRPDTIRTLIEGQ
jgi:glycerophosphoryl diester phosphodiesterase